MFTYALDRYTIPIPKRFLLIVKYECREPVVREVSLVMFLETYVRFTDKHDGSVTVGTTALPVIMKLYKIMSAKKTGWSQQDELPVEIPLSEDLRFHSVFACPVSKEQATESNPPMMMPCGHVICKESLMRLSKSSNSRYGRQVFKNSWVTCATYHVDINSSFL